MKINTDMMTDAFVRFLGADACDESDLWVLTEEQMEFVRDLDERDPEIARLVNGAAQ